MYFFSTYSEDHILIFYNGKRFTVIFAKKTAMGKFVLVFVALGWQFVLVFVLVFVASKVTHAVKSEYVCID